MRLIPGDCREAMTGFMLDGEMFDAVVTDPPYHLTSIVDRFGKPGAAPAKSEGATGVYGRASRGFMGKEWDGGDIAFDPMTWRAAYECLKPGGHLVAFGGSRTYQRDIENRIMSAMLA
jgi:site-specific DNA-methyltransferase (adenine-specific)